MSATEDLMSFKILISSKGIGTANKQELNGPSWTLNDLALPTIRWVVAKAEETMHYRNNNFKTALISRLLILTTLTAAAVLLKIVL